MNGKKLGSEVGLLFFGAIACLCSATVIAGFAMPLFAGWALGWQSGFAKLAIAVLALDGAKLAILLPLAWLFGPRLSLNPWLASTVLLVLTYGLDLSLAALLRMTSGFFADPLLLGLRGAGLLLMIGLTAAVLKRRKPTTIADKHNEAPEEVNEI